MSRPGTGCNANGVKYTLPGQGGGRREGNDLEKQNEGNLKEGQDRQSAGDAIFELVTVACREKVRQIRAKLTEPGQMY